MTRRAVALGIAILALAIALPARATGTPRGVHVSFGADPRTEATIVWFTEGTAEPGRLEFGDAPDTLDRLADAVGALSPGEYPSPVTVHEVRLTGLTPGSEVFYRARNGAAASPVRSFRTAPANDGPFSFTAFGDHGVKPQSIATTTGVIGADPDFHLIAGDLSYAYHGDGTFPTWTDWDVWFDQLEPLAAATPVMPALGNHEMESVGGTDTYRARFALPGDELTYSFDYRNVHVLVFNSDRTAGLQEQHLVPQLAFAAQDLADARARRDAGEIDFIVVVQHHPLYGISDSSLESEVIERHYNPYLIATQEQLLHANDVDVLITAHNHIYTRSFPMRSGVPTSMSSTTTTADDLIQVTTGGGGQGLHAILPADQRPDWVAAAARRFHFTEFSIDGPVMTVRALATDGAEPELIDQFTITRAS